MVKTLDRILLVAAIAPAVFLGANPALAVDCAPCGTDCNTYNVSCSGTGGTVLNWNTTCSSSCGPDKFKIYRFAQDQDCTFTASYIGEVKWAGNGAYTFTDTSNPNQCRAYKVQLYTSSGDLLCSIVQYDCGSCPCYP